MPNGGLLSGWTVARIFGISIRLHASWLLIFFLLVWSLATYVLPLSDMAGGGPFWEGADVAEDMARYARSHPNADREEAARFVGVGLWPEWHYWVLGVVGSLGLFVCVLAHELSHSVVAQAEGIAVEGITLFVFGGVSRIRDDAASPGAEFRIAVAGPLMSLALGLACWAFYWLGGNVLPEQATGILAYFMFINIALMVFNMLPGFPLDGGRILRAILWATIGDIRRATLIASYAGRILAGLLIAVGAADVLMSIVQPGHSTGLGAIWWIVIGLFLYNAAKASYTQLALKQAFQGLTVGDAIQADAVTVTPDLTLEQLVDDYIYRYRFRSFPVLDQGRLVAMIGLKDVQAVPRGEWAQRRVSDIMRQVQPGNLVHARDDLASVFRKMMQEDVGHLPVVDGDRLVGIVTRHDIMRLLELKTDLGGNRQARA